MAERSLVKVCGITRREDALAVDRAGADYLGVVLSAGFARSVDPARARALVEGVGPIRVAVLVNEESRAAEAAALALGAGVIQLHGDEAPSFLAELRARGSWRLWKAVRARVIDDVERAVERYADVADGILVEGWREGVVGGGGVRLELDPEGIRGMFPKHLQFILAGGLVPDSVADAIRAFRPDVVDVSSGVERTKGEKDARLVARFVEAVRGPATVARAGEPSAGGGAR